MNSSKVLDGVGKETVNFVFENHRQLVKMAAILSAAELLVWWIFPVGILFEIVEALLAPCFYAIFAISIHRWIIIDEMTFPPAINGRVWYFVGAILLEGLIVGLAFAVWAAPGILIGVLSKNVIIYGLVMAVSAVVMLVFAMWFISRMITVYPHIAVAPMRTFRMGSGFEISKEPVWEIAKRLLVFGVITAVLAAVIGVMTPEGIVNKLSAIGQRTVLAPVAYLYLLAGYAPIPFFVALASFVYRRILDDMRQQVAVQTT